MAVVFQRACMHLLAVICVLDEDKVLAPYLLVFELTLQVAFMLLYSSLCLLSLLLYERSAFFLLTFLLFSHLLLEHLS